jgi:pimeloyl-ACP methyl ester carboxylesterase
MKPTISHKILRDAVVKELERDPEVVANHISVALRQGRVDFHPTRGEFVMASISERENREIEAANASVNIPVVFIHGLWLLPSSWANWADFFKQAGYAPLTPDWPDDPETVEEARANPDVLAKKTLKQIADHTTEIINALEKKPVVIGHSTGACWRRCSRAGASRRPRWRSTPESSAAFCLCRARCSEE